MKQPTKNDFPTAEDWILAKAEEYEEKLQLAINTILVFQSLNWFKKIFKSKKLFRTFFKEMSVLDRKHRQISEEIQKELAKAVNTVVKDHKKT